jgi:hypothetical protein
MRAIICMKFPAYTFEMVDALPLSKVYEIYASCQWLSTQEKKAIDEAKRKIK